MTATDELRRLLDERGVEWRGARQREQQAIRLRDGTFRVQRVRVPRIAHREVV